MIDQINPQFKSSNHKGRAIASLVIGIIDMIGEIIVFLSFISFRFPQFWRDVVFQSYSIGVIVFLFLYLGWLFSILGIILGIFGFSSTKKGLALSGIIMSMVSLGAYIYIFAIALRIAQG